MLFHSCWRFQNIVYLALDISLCTDARGRVAGAATVAATHLARRADVLTHVLLSRVNLFNTSLAKHDAALACRHRLQEVVVVDLW